MIIYNNFAKFIINYFGGMMPLFEYLCEECNEKYDIYHKTSEKPEDIICPHCSSKKHIKQFSTFSATVTNPISNSRPENCHSCCNSQMCGLN